MGPFFCYGLDLGSDPEPDLIPIKNDVQILT